MWFNCLLPLLCLSLGLGQQPGSRGPTDYDYGSPHCNYPWQSVPGDPDTCVTEEPERYCENRTIQLKTSWSIPTGRYALDQICLYKIKIPRDSYAVAEVWDRDWQLFSWYKLDNVLGYSFEKRGDYFDNYQISSLPHPSSEFFILFSVNGAGEWNRTLSIFKLTRRKYQLENVKTIDLGRDIVVASRLSDFFIEDEPISLISTDDLHTVTLCDRDYVYSGMGQFGNSLTYYGSIPQNIFVLKRGNGSAVEFIDSLHSNYFNRQVWPGGSIFYPGAMPRQRPCVFLAMSAARKSDFRQITVSYAGFGAVGGSGRTRSPFKEFSLNATDKPSCLVLFAREKELNENATAVMGAWLLDVAVQGGGVLSLYSGFPSPADNASQLIATFSSPISSPVFLGCLIHTFVLNQGVVKLKFTEFLDLKDPSTAFTSLSYKNAGNASQLIVFTGDTRTEFPFKMTLTDGDGDPSTRDGTVSVPGGYYDDNFRRRYERDYFQANGTILFSHTNPEITVYPGVEIQLSIQH